MILLGNLKLERLPIFSFLIKNPETGFYLHYNYVTKLLNDLFGIQSRSGCACAGPYGHYLLGIDDQLGEKYLNKLVTRDQNSCKIWIGILFLIIISALIIFFLTKKNIS